MKKSILITLLSITLLKCKEKEPIINYNCGTYFNQNDWKNTGDDNINPIYTIDKKIKLSEYNDKDSTQIFTQIFTKETINLYPKGYKLSKMILLNLIICKYKYLHEETFNPQKIEIYNSIGKYNDFLIVIEFITLNKEYVGYFIHDKNTFETKQIKIYQKNEQPTISTNKRTKTLQRNP